MSAELVIGYQKIVFIILLIATGFVLRKKQIFTKELQGGITNFLFKFIIPIAIFNSFANSEFDGQKLKESIIIIVISLIFYPAAQLLGKLLYINVKDEKKKRMLTFATAYANQTFMGLPFVQAIFGAGGLLAASMFNLPYNIYLWSIGFATLTALAMNKDGVKKTFTNPIIIACFIGFAWWILKGSIPVSEMLSTVSTPIKDVLNTLGGVNTPLSMLIIGAMLAEAKFGAMLSDKLIWYFAFVKLILLPVIVFAILYMVGFREYVLAIPVTMVAMPTCATGAIICGQYDIHPDFSASIVTFTTVLSAITIPIWLIVLITIA